MLHFAPKKVIYCKFNNFGTACRVGSIFEGNIEEDNPDVLRESMTPTSGPKISNKFKITNVIFTHNL